jgi:diketogulonate reductase-like aldo/keto reductase
MSDIPRVTLNSGKTIPVLGVGTFKAPANVVKQFFFFFFD